MSDSFVASRRYFKIFNACFSKGETSAQKDPWNFHAGRRGRGRGGVGIPWKKSLISNGALLNAYLPFARAIYSKNKNIVEENIVSEWISASKKKKIPSTLSDQNFFLFSSILLTHSLEGWRIDVKLLISLNIHDIFFFSPSRRCIKIQTPQGENYSRFLWITHGEKRTISNPWKSRKGKGISWLIN